MKKFKSLMLAALASAALAAPSFADGHSLKASGEVVLGMKYTTNPRWREHHHSSGYLHR